MRYAALLALVTALASGCRTGHHGRVRTTPLEVSGPVTVSGPITVTGPVTVGTATTTTTTIPSPAVTHAHPPASTSSSHTHGIHGDGVHLELKTEDLTVDRRTTSNGAARIRKYVVTEERSIPVTLRREEFTVERVPASGVPTTPFGEASSVIDIPLTVETAVGVVTPRVIEVIRVHKTVETDTKEIKGVLRTEKVDITKAN